MITAYKAFLGLYSSKKKELSAEEIDAIVNELNDDVFDWANVINESVDPYIFSMSLDNYDEIIEDLTNVLN